MKDKDMYVCLACSSRRFLFFGKISSFSPERSPQIAPRSLLGRVSILVQSVQYCSVTIALTTESLELQKILDSFVLNLLRKKVTVKLALKVSASFRNDTSEKVLKKCYCLKATFN